MRRVTIVWSASTVSQAAGIGSSASAGADAWPPRPESRTWSVSAEAAIVPAREETTPLFSCAVMWIANAAATGGATSRSPSSSMTRAPKWPSSPGWNMKSTRPWRRSRCEASRRAAAASIAVCVSWPHACIAPSTSEANSRPVASVIGSASMSPLRSRVGPGCAPSSTAITEEHRPGSLERLHDGRLRLRQPEPDLGAAMQAPPERDRVLQQLTGLLEELHLSLPTA